MKDWILVVVLTQCPKHVVHVKFLVFLHFPAVNPKPACLSLSVPSFPDPESAVDLH